MVLAKRGKATSSRGGERLPVLRERAWHISAFIFLALGTFLYLFILMGPIPRHGIGWWINALVALILWGASVALGSLVVQLLVQFGRLPWRARWLAVATLIFLGVALWRALASPVNVLGVLLAVTVVSIALGAGLGSTPPRSRAAKIALAIGVLGLTGLLAWGIWPGPTRTAPPGWASPVDLDLESPALGGPFEVRAMTYGSGNDRRRPEYGSEVDLRTASVDISGMVEGWNGLVGWSRSAYWGFGPTDVPLNARVWYPDGPGPFPLVLVVHGNHLMFNCSDIGYEYLADTLASRGYIVASVDQNFLNGSGGLEVFMGGLRGDNNARAYLLLKHLALWHEWNDEPDGLFPGMVDTDRIALVGHSRGGEAVATAAAFNPLPAHPGDASIPFDFGFNIRALVGIAPADGQYLPGGRPTALQDVSYLVLQGSADADVRSFEGSVQYDRVSFSGDEAGFKAAVYVRDANHGQFNSAWGRVDIDSLRPFLNRAALLTRADQELTAQVFIGAFLEAALREDDRYRAVFAHPHLASGWLPEDVAYVSQYREARWTPVATYAEDLDLETATLAGARITGTNLSLWREEPIRLGRGTRRAVPGAHLGWDLEGSAEEEASPEYRVRLPAGASPAETEALLLSVAHAAPDDGPLDFTVSLADDAGVRARIDIADVAPLQPPFPYRTLKPPMPVRFEWEPVFSTYVLPLSEFAGRADAFDVGALREIRLVFDGSPRGRVVIDEMGFVPSPSLKAP